MAFRLFVPVYEALPTSSLEQDGKPELGFGPRISRDDSANESRNQVPAARIYCGVSAGHTCCWTSPDPTLPSITAVSNLGGNGGPSQHQHPSCLIILRLSTAAGTAWSDHALVTALHEQQLQFDS